MLVSATALFAQSMGDIITEQPAGKEYTLYGTAKGYTEFWQVLMDFELDGTASRAVFADDGTVYLYNPISTYDSKSWLKGKLDKSTNIVTFSLPQTIFKEVTTDENDTPYTEYIIAYKMVYSDELKTYLATPDDQELKFTWDGKELSMIGNQFIGIASADGTWYGLGDEAKTYVVLDDKAVAPESADKAKTYLMTFKTADGAESSQAVSVETEGNSLYVKGISKNMPEAWIKGEISGDKATFAGKQYLGVDSKNLSHDYFMPLDADGNPMESVTMSYNAQDESLSCTDLLTVNFGKNTVKSLESFYGPSFAQWSNPKEAPSAPVIKECTPDDGTYTWFSFTLPTKTEDGVALDVDKLYYNIYFDDKLFTFTTSPYSTFEKDMSDIPYDFSDDDYFITKQGNDRIIYTYKRDFTKLGVQCFYLDGENKLKSKMTEWSNTNGISGIAASDSGNVTWTDISGRAVKKPSKGIFIKTVKTADGTTVSKHVFR